MTENFRGKASHIVLANQIIGYNRDRQPKRIQLTQGFDGETVLRACPDQAAMADAVAQDLSVALGKGVQPDDCAILVRFYAQTPSIEQALAQEGIPYHVTGNGSASHRLHNGVTITTIFKAKGLEWPWVCIPNCNQGIFPPERPGRIEEERRLFYVGITCARQDLYLYSVDSEPISPFLEEAYLPTLVEAVREIREALVCDPADWDIAAFAAVAVNARRLHLNGYFARWWDADYRQKQRVAQAVLQFYATARQHGVLRQLDIGVEEVQMWRTLAGAQSDPAPLAGPEFDDFFARFRPAAHTYAGGLRRAWQGVRRLLTSGRSALSAGTSLSGEKR